MLATFEGEVDTIAGTVTIRSTPTATSRALGVTPSVTLDVDVTVTIANHGAGFSISGVAAEIQTFAGTGSESCSNDPGPVELSAQYGIWSYGIVGPNATSAGKKWIFKYNSGAHAYFTFSGRVVGVKMYRADEAAHPFNPVDYSLPGVYGCGMADTGVGIAMARVDASSPPNRYFIDLVGHDGVRTRTVSVPAGVLSIAATTNKIWYSTQADDSVGDRYVGSMVLDGSGEAHAPMTNEYCPLQTIVPDPGNAKAWFLSGGFNEIRSYTPPTTVGTEATVQSPPYSMALGPDGRLYVSTVEVKEIKIYSIATDPATDLLTPIVIPAALGCTGPGYMASGPGGKLWSGANDGADGNSICTVSPAGNDVTKFASVPNPGAFAFGDAGKVWTTSTYATTDRQLQRVDPTGTGYGILTAPGGSTNPGGIATSAGAVWVTDVHGLWRVVP